MSYDPRWQCYEKTARPAGEESTRAITTTRRLEVRIQMGAREPMVLHRRKRDYRYEYGRSTSYGDPWIDELTSGVNDGGVGLFATSGRIDEVFGWLDRAIVFMDLRHDLVVLSESSGDVSFSGAASGPLGQQIIDVGIGLRGELINDVVGVDCGHDRRQASSDDVLLGERRLAVGSGVSVAHVPLRLGATDFSGFVHVNDYSNDPWGSYGVVDQGKPYSKDNYTELYSHDHGAFPADYLPPWIEVARYRTLDRQDAALFAAYWGRTVSESVPIDIPLFVETFPVGSWVVDRDDNLFCSQLGSGAGVFSRIVDSGGNEVQPETVVDMEHSGLVVYYPICLS